MKLLPRVRLFSTAIQPFDAIPGPKFVSKELFPGGQLYKKPFPEIHTFYRAKYGNIVRLPGFLGRPGLVLIYDPKDFEQVYRTEGKWPIRPAFNSIKYYRKKVRPDVFSTGGLLAEHNQRWSEFRSIVNPVMLQPKIVLKYVTKIDEVTQEFVEITRASCDADGETPADFGGLIQRWAFESIGIIALNTRLGSLKPSAEKRTVGDRLAYLVEEILKISYQLDVTPSILRSKIWSPKLRRFIRFSDEITEIVMKILDAAVEKIEKEGSSSEGVLEKLIKENRDVAIVNAFDMLMVGIDTTSASVKSLLYLLAKNPEKQQKLRTEILTILPDKSEALTPENVRNLPYLRACMKESQRIYPVATEAIRKTNTALTLQGYHIPKGVNVAMANAILLNSEDNFPKPREFIPERWLKDTQTQEIGCPHAKTAHPFSYLPFGFGPRICIGKRFAELEIENMAIRMVRNFEMSWHYEEPTFESTFVRSMQGAMKFKLKDVE